MIYFWGFLLELLILFFISRFLTRLLSRFLFSITHNEQLTINLLSILFLPGVIVHELSHFTMARVLFVNTGEMEFLPRVEKQKILHFVQDDRKKVQDDSREQLEVKLGSVAIAKTDPIRRLIIGIAPLLFGVGILLVILWNSNSFLPASLSDLWRLWSWGRLGGILYVVFQISTTMFSSRKDMEGALKIVIIAILLYCFFYLAGGRIQFSLIEHLFTPQVSEFFYKCDIFLLVPLLINSGVWGMLKTICKYQTQPF